jgi:twinkle protein
MTQWAKTHQPCPCGKSSDAYAVALDGHGRCFSCGKNFYEDKLDTQDYTYEYIARRGITKATHEFFGVKAQINAEGKPVSVAYPFENGAAQIKYLDRKDFRSIGDMSATGGWGLDKFPAGSAKAITITEGNDDAMSVFQMLGGYPVYAVKSASTALRDVRRDFDRLNSFGKIYLALDNDDPGKKATAEIAACFDFNKVYHVKLAPLKDATEYLENQRVTEFRNAWYGAGRFLPEGIVSSFSDIDAILDNAEQHPGHPWPFKTLNHLTDGIKPGRSYLLSGLEGIGKTEFFHAVEYHLAKTDPEANIAIIHLEEPTDENVRKLVGYELRVPTTLSDSSVSKEEIKKVYRAIAGREDRIHFYNHFGSDDPDILLSKIRFFAAACKCKYIFLDNITITATGRHTEDERKELDYLSTQLEMLVKALKFSLVVISHENATGQTRGSYNISKVFDVWINMRRDISATDEYTRNQQFLQLLKGRGCRGTGPAGVLIYDPGTATLSEYTEKQELPT